MVVVFPRLNHADSPPSVFHFLLKKLFPDAEKDALRHIVADNLRVCFVRQKRGRKYNDGMTIGMHAKHFIIDDVCTYVGRYVCFFECFDWNFCCNIWYSYPQYR